MPLAPGAIFWRGTTGSMHWPVRDTVYGGAGDDTLVGGAGRDALYGDAR